jgi:MoxR-like ATPase
MTAVVGARVTPHSVEAVHSALAAERYVADDALATAVFLALRMRRPLLLEGEAGVGKTQVAKTLATVLGAELVRLQCYEGIEASQALYEWDYPRQLLLARAAFEADGTLAATHLYREEFLLERPLLKALRMENPEPVLLIDEIDRADNEFEAFLLEVLSEFSVTIPELGTITARTPPLVILTSNRTRELHDALKRRCLYHWIDYPSVTREAEIIRLRAPLVPARLATSVARTVAALRKLDILKRPGAAEAIDWAEALRLLGAEEARGPFAKATLGCAIKNREDIDHVRRQLPHLVGDA